MRPLTLCDRDVFRFFNEEEIVQSFDERGDNWDHSLSRSSFQSFF